MNIPAINSLNMLSVFQTKRNNNVNYSSSFGLKPAKPLSQDVVSFRGGTRISKFMEAGLEKEEPKLKAIATQFLDAAEAIANKLKEKGVSFDRVYCEKGCIKKPDSCVSKIERSGILNIPDRIRTTIYVKNPYDLTVLDTIIHEYENRGYKIAQTEVPVAKAFSMGFSPKSAETRKGLVKINDIDIRLNDTADEPITGKSPEIIRYISGANANGYEDIQIRFINLNAQKQFRELPHELIILMGPNYSKAKSEESNWIYNALREFKTLNIAQDTNLKNPVRMQASRYADLIKKMVSDEISSKLFENAKNKDFYEIDEVNPIKIDKKQQALLNGYFECLREKLIIYYRDMQKMAEDSLAKRKLCKNLKNDKMIIDEIQEKLNKAVNYFNKQTSSKSATV